MSAVDLSKLTAAESPEDREAAATEVAKQVTSKVRSRRLKRTSDPCTCRPCTLARYGFASTACSPLVVRLRRMWRL